MFVNEKWKLTSKKERTRKVKAENPEIYGLCKRSKMARSSIE